MNASEGARENREQSITQITQQSIRQGGKGSAGAIATIPIPREATSVATMMGLLPVLNSFRTQSRSFCCLSP